MITPHFQTLITLAQHWHKVARADDMNEQHVNELALVLGPLLLRPEVRVLFTVVRLGIMNPL